MMRTLLILAILVHLPIASHAQTDTILVGYLTPNGTALINTELLVLAGSSYGVVQNFDNYCGAMITDEQGQVQHLTVFETVEGYQVRSCSYMFEDANRFVFIGNGTKDNQDYFPGGRACRPKVVAGWYLLLSAQDGRDYLAGW